MRIKMNQVWLAGIVLFTIKSTMVYAARPVCTPEGQRTPNHTVTISEKITVPRDLPVGSKIGNEVSLAINENFKCTISGGVTTGLYMRTTTSDSGIKDGALGIYKTNVDGIGFAMGITSSCVSYKLWVAGNLRLVNFGLGSIAQCKNISSTFVDTTLETIFVQLYKIGDVIPGKINISSVAGVGIVENPLPATNVYDYRLVDLVSTSPVEVQQCTVKTKNVTTKMGNIFDSDLVTVGSTSENKTVNIELECDAGANVWGIISATQETQGSQPGAIKLSGAGTDGVAAGIALQLLDNNNKVVTVNEKKKLVTAANKGDVKINWKARYIRTGEIKPGMANATATLSITYE